MIAVRVGGGGNGTAEMAQPGKNESSVVLFCMRSGWVDERGVGVWRMGGMIVGDWLLHGW